jgi:cobalt-zinc-cadmium efflux system membrane fusion protein
MHFAPSDTMLEIIETDHLHLELNVFEKNLKVKVRDINFTVPEATNEIFHAEVHLVGNQLKEMKERLTRHLDENLKQRLITGMLKLQLWLIPKGLAIPTEALITEN